MPLTTRLEIDDQTNGSNNNTWGEVADSNFQILEQAIAGVTSIATTGGTTTLTSSQNRFPIIVITGTLVSNATINVRAAEKNWQFINATSGAFTVTVKTPSGSGQVLPRGQHVTLYCDGTNVLPVPTVLARTATSVGGTANAVTLTFSPAFSGFVDGMEVSFRATAANTGAMTIQCDLLAAKNFQMDASGTLAATFSGAVQPGMAIIAKYNLAADAFVWLNQKPVFIDGSGNVAVGNSTTYGALYVYRPTANTYARLENGQFVDTYFSFKNAGSAQEFFVGLANVGADSALWDRGNRNLLFATNNLERCRLSSSGDFLIGTNNGSVVNGTAGTGFAVYQAGSFAAVSNGFSATIRRLASDGGVVLFGRDSTSVGNISVTTTSTAYNTTSDYRLKERVLPLHGALAKVAQLKPCSYTWKVDGSAGEGFIAHELQDVIPLAVTGEKDAVSDDGRPDYQAVDLSKVVPVLVAAIQELAAQVSDLKARVNA